MDSALNFTFYNVSPPGEENVHKLSQTPICASMPTLPPISTHESSQAVNGPVSI